MAVNASRATTDINQTMSRATVRYAQRVKLVWVDDAFNVELAERTTIIPLSARRTRLGSVESAHSVVLAKSRTVPALPVDSAIQEQRELVECAHSVLMGASQTRSQSPVSNARQVVPVKKEHASSVPQVSR